MDAATLDSPRPNAVDPGPQVRTLLLTDLCDSTSLVERLGDTAAAALFREHDRLVLELQQRWRGRLIDRSDGMLLLFERPVDGLGFALDYMRGLRALGERPEWAQRKLDLKARAGLHVGELVTWRNSDAAVQAGAKPLEVEGLAKPFAARLMTLARPGQILLSAVAEPLARRAARELGERSEHLLWKSHGRWRFKGVPDVQEIFEAGEPGFAPLRLPAGNGKAWRDLPLWRRPAALAAEVLLLVGLGTGAWFITRPQPAIAFNERDWVVVGDLRNLTGESVLDDSLEQAFRISLEQSRHVNVLSDLKARDTLQRMRRTPGTSLDRAIASEIALRDGARAVILPTVSEVGGRVRVSAEVIDPHTQTTVYAESADGSGLGSTLTSIDEVTAALRGKLGEALASIDKDSEPLPQVTTSNLDALRAYALARQAFGQGHYEKSKGFYERAVQMDPDFALAHLGLFGAHNALLDRANGFDSLHHAVALRQRLSPRDALYLAGWVAEVEAPDQALMRWRQLADLYPDYFSASVNVGFRLMQSNRFDEGLRYARVAASKQSMLSPLAWELLGRLHLGLNQYPVAASAFQNGAAEGSKFPSIRLADAYAAQRKFDAAEVVWQRARASEGLNFNRISLHLDQARWPQAEAEARRLQAYSSDKGTGNQRLAQYPLVVMQWLQGDTGPALATLRSTAEGALTALASGASADKEDDAYLAVSAGLLAQRLGDRSLARRVLKQLDGQPLLLAIDAVRDLMETLRANDQRLAGRADEAVTRLEAQLNGHERFETHAALMEAYAASGRLDKALEQAKWLSSHRGTAYSEMGCAWCQQPLNVADTTLAYLRSAELLAATDKQQALRELRIFDGYWPRAVLPGGLRARREAVARSLD